MPFLLPLSKALCQAGWKVKIYDFERLEPPHVTICRKKRKWRLSLRDGSFLDLGDKWNQIDGAVRASIETAWQPLRDEWDAIHPDNPVIGEGHDDNQ